MKMMWNRKIQGLIVEICLNMDAKTYGCKFELADGERTKLWHINQEQTEFIHLGEIEADVTSFVYENIVKLLRVIRKGKSNE